MICGLLWVRAEPVTPAFEGRPVSAEALVAVGCGYWVPETLPDLKVACWERFMEF